MQFVEREPVAFPSEKNNQGVIVLKLQCLCYKPSFHTGTYCINFLLLHIVIGRSIRTLPTVE
jgi:hypothetical protein